MDLENELYLLLDQPKPLELRVVPSTDTLAVTENDEYSRVVFGRSISNRFINKAGLMKMFNQLWQNKACEKVEDYTDGIFILTFASITIKNRVLRGQPWNFAGSYLVLIDPSGLDQITDANFKGISFWTHVYGIPFRNICPSLGKDIANTIGNFIEYDSTKRPFMRFRVSLDFSKPIQKGIKLDLGLQRDPIWISFKYERLNKFCFFCGCLDHVQKNCVTFLEEIENGLNPILVYDESLKADPLPLPPIPLTNPLEENKQLIAQTGKEKGRLYSENFSPTDYQKNRKQGNQVLWDTPSQQNRRLEKVRGVTKWAEMFKKIEVKEGSDRIRFNLNKSVYFVMGLCLFFL